MTGAVSCSLLSSLPVFPCNRTSDSSIWLSPKRLISSLPLKLGETMHVNSFWPIKYNQRCSLQLPGTFLKRQLEPDFYSLFLFVSCSIFLPIMWICGLELWQPSWTMRWRPRGGGKTVAWRSLGPWGLPWGNASKLTLDCLPLDFYITQEQSSILFKLLLFGVLAPQTN